MSATTCYLLLRKSAKSQLCWRPAAVPPRGRIAATEQVQQHLAALQTPLQALEWASVT